MFNAGVTAETFDLMSCDMAKVHFFTAVAAFKQMWFGVALDTDVVHDMAITIDYAEVALFTIYPAFEVIFVNERLIFIGINEYLGFCLSVAGLAVRDFLVFLPLIKVAVKTGRFRHREMFTLNYLRVAADAFEFLAPT